MKQFVLQNQLCSFIPVVYMNQFSEFGIECICAWLIAAIVGKSSRSIMTCRSRQPLVESILISGFVIVVPIGVAFKCLVHGSASRAEVVRVGCVFDRQITAHKKVCTTQFYFMLFNLVS